MRESVTQHLYGTSKKDHINYSNISSIEHDSNEKTQGNETAERSQQPTDQRRIVLPSFEEMINYVYEMNEKRLSNSSAQHYTYGRINLAYSYETFTEVRSLF